MRRAMDSKRTPERNATKAVVFTTPSRLVLMRGLTAYEKPSGEKRFFLRWRGAPPSGQKEAGGCFALNLGHCPRLTCRRSRPRVELEVYQLFSGLAPRPCGGSTNEFIHTEGVLFFTKRDFADALNSGPIAPLSYASCRCAAMAPARFLFIHNNTHAGMLCAWAAATQAPSRRRKRTGCF
jgi:hypothetical protein